MIRTAARTLSLLLVLALPSSAFAGDVARVGDTTITSEELERAASARLLRVRTDIYEAERETLDRLLSDALVVRRAKAAGVLPAEWLERETARRVAPVTDEEVAKVYESATGQITSLPREQGLAAIAGDLRQIRRDEAREALLRDLRTEAKAEVLLKPPRIRLDLGGTPIHGPDEAPVKVVVFEDFQCPFCARLAPTIAALGEIFRNDIQIVHRDLPLRIHRDARKAAEAAACANEQGKYWDFSRKMYEHQKTLDVASLKKYAAEVGLDESFGACLDSGQYARVWQEDSEAARKLGLASTPATFINGRLLAGVRGFDQLAEVIEEELAAARKR